MISFQQNCGPAAVVRHDDIVDAFIYAADSDTGVLNKSGLEQRSEAWCAVFDTLREVDPSWLRNHAGSAQDAACEAIRALAAGSAKFIEIVPEVMEFRSQQFSLRMIGFTDADPVDQALGMLDDARETVRCLELQARVNGEQADEALTLAETLSATVEERDGRVRFLEEQVAELERRNENQAAIIGRIQRAVFNPLEF